MIAIQEAIDSVQGGCMIIAFTAFLTHLGRDVLNHIQPPFITMVLLNPTGLRLALTKITSHGDLIL
jgi:hypothetical protein